MCSPPRAVADALRGCTRLFHIAGMVSTRARDCNALFRINADGAAAVLEAALKAGVEKVVYTSTAGALGAAHDGTPVPEDVAFAVWDRNGPYLSSKRQRLERALALRDRGQPGSKVRPFAEINDGIADMRAGRFGRVVLAFSEERAQPRQTMRPQPVRARGRSG